MWDEQVRILRAKGWHTQAPDLPGHGGRMAEEFTLDAAIQTIDDAIGRCGGRVHLVGCSLGGMLAIHAAARTTRPLASLIAAGCSTQPGVGTARLYGRLIGFVDSIGGEDIIRLVIGEDGAHHFLRRGRAGLATVRGALTAVAGLDLVADLAAVDAPVAILNGHLDQFRLEERRFARAARVGRLVVLGYGTHMVNLTHPHAYTDALEGLMLDAETLPSRH